MAATVLAIFVFLDTDQLMFMVVGAAMYMIFYALQRRTTERKPLKTKAKAHLLPQGPAGDTPRRASARGRLSPKEPRPPTASARDEAPGGPQESRPPTAGPRRADKLFGCTQATASFALERRSLGDLSTPPSRRGLPRPSATPLPAKEAEAALPRPAVTAPSFLASGVDAEVSELLAQISPTAADEAAIGRLVWYVTQAISPIFPEAEVLGFASAKLTGSSAFGVAVPEVDLVIDLNPVALHRRAQGAAGSAHLDEHKLQKHVVRKCAGRLVERAGFKFRRSAFGGPDPKVTLLLPSSAGLFTEPIPLDMVVNSAGPMRASALLTECGAIDPRAKELILLVRRWAKDRGVSHAARGYLPPYAWSVLVVYFLQAGVAGSSILPPFHCFKAGGAASIPKRRGSLKESDETVSQLFIDFFRFYAVKFELRREAVSARDAVRCPPDGQGRDGPVIEDPFEPDRNLAEGIQRAELERTSEELARAHTMFSAKCSLTALLEPWMPPEANAGGAKPSAMGGEGQITGTSDVSGSLPADV